MLKELNSFCVGALRGATAGAIAGFVLAGTVGLAMALIAGGGFTIVAGTWFGSIAMEAISLFIGSGMLGVLPGAIIGFARESIRESREEAKIQQQITHAHEIEQKSRIAEIAISAPTQKIGKSGEAPATAVSKVNPLSATQRLENQSRKEITQSSAIQY